MGVKLFLFSLSCFQKTYFKQTVSKILPFSFTCSQKTYLQTGSEILPFSFFLVFRRHIYKKEKKKTIPHSNSVFSPCFPNTYLQKKEERKRKTSCTFKFCLFSLVFRTHNYKQTKTSCAFKFCRHIEAVEGRPDKLQALGK